MTKEDVRQSLFEFAQDAIKLLEPNSIVDYCNEIFDKDGHFKRGELND